MIKNLTPIGNSLGLIIDRPILKLLGIDRDTELEITTDGETLIIQPVREGAVSKETEAVVSAREAVSVKDAGKNFLDELRGAFK
ncbi:MAG: AbrB/MazE/SpoVT family DNA-binding domain-containing protein [Mariprofundaceae bacterium]|nr:AbrB/MazE/SpoVT family DNA-binding domain-containing protein [Mariprofundaceae bacterium]